LRVLKVKNVPGRDKLLILQYQKIRKWKKAD
jgi:O-succinylbenzoate synthase